jgi:hypothetical protein
VTNEQLIAMLVDRARSDGLQLTGEGGLLQQLTTRQLGPGLCISVRACTCSATSPARTST